MAVIKLTGAATSGRVYAVIANVEAVKEVGTEKCDLYLTSGARVSVQAAVSTVVTALGGTP